MYTVFEKKGKRKREVWFERRFLNILNFGGWWYFIGLMAVQPINLRQVTFVCEERERVPDAVCCSTANHIFSLFSFHLFLSLFHHFSIVISNMSQLLQSLIEWLRSLFFKVNKNMIFKSRERLHLEWFPCKYICILDRNGVNLGWLTKQW